MEANKNIDQLQVLILGTGTSSQLPMISCLTDPNGAGCASCTSSDKKDYRRNTSAIIRIHRNHNCQTSPINSSSSDSNQTEFGHILIDVGKSFCEAAREHFPKNRIRRLDAVVLSHPHADAINGLDDLRAWTLEGAIQDSIPIYCNPYTYREISKAHGYLIDHSAKTGGGDVPAFEWHVIENDESFEVLGVKITPLPVHHGKFFDSSAPSGIPRPYVCLGFLFDSSICYMADVSHIPESTWTVIERFFSNSLTTLPVLIIDTLRIQSHSSHFGIAQAVQAARRLSAMRTYLLGFAHRASHQCWVHCCEAISRGDQPGVQEDRPPNELVRQGIVEDFQWFTQIALRSIQRSSSSNSDSSPIWVRPAFDGLWVTTNGQSVWDDGYGE